MAYLATSTYLALSLVALDSIPAIRSIAHRIARKSRDYEPIQLAKDVYRDEDGEATEESLREFSDKWQRIAIALFSIAGFLVTLASAVLATLKLAITNSTPLVWLQFGVWILLAIQAVAFFAEPRPTSRYVLGHFAFWGSIITIAVPGIELGILIFSRLGLPHGRLWVGLQLAQIACAALRAVPCVLLPRRPDIYYEDKLVERELSVSLLSRFTFSWANGLLNYAVKHKTMDLDDIPRLTASNRAAFLCEKFETARQNRKLWVAIVAAHWRSLLVQTTLSLTICFLSFGPQVALFQILKTLELRDTPDWNVGASYIWVLALGGLLFVASSVEAWLIWVVYSRLGVPIYAELSAVIFAKAMRRKDVKHTKKSKPDNSDNSSKGSAEVDDDDDHVLKKSRQSIINHVAVDSRRVSDFASLNYIIPQAIFRIMIGAAFLVQILGWRSAFAGLSVSLLVTPLNVYAARKYSNAQDRLMKSRDQKLAIVTEVLQGIRQIKFSALEEQWQERVRDTRETELGALWASFLADIGLLAIWVLGPVGLSAVSLTTYAIINGTLSPSVAFTAMAVFNSLEVALAVIPELMSMGLEAKVSSERIDKFLATPENVVNTVPADYIAFEDVSAAWPAEAEDIQDLEDRFVLRDMTLKFPTKSLSVVSGRTGSGKSLLLSSIMGECDVLAGTIKVPVPPPIKDRFDHLATKANWIIDSAIAYVAQTPWIENATIKANVLFGLPDDAERYQEVIFACALEKDFEMLPDGDMTDIGANGVNLSGGQRWRISFARALYSRAGILIMDDIFSALDAHTGRHVFEQALTGKLGQNRTRILVTHHVALCLPRTDYSVLLENGRIKYAGTIDDLKESHHLEDILGKEHATEQADLVADGEDREFFNDEETTLQKVISNTSHQKPNIATNGSASNGNGIATTQTKPKKFVEDEKRETGSVRLAVYISFLNKGGSVVYWLVTLSVYLMFSSLMVGRSWWINVWTSSSSNTKAHPEQYSVLLQHTMRETAPVPQHDDLYMYLGVYAAISITACIIGTVRYYCILSASVRASRNLFNGLIYAILRAPLRWLDTVPLGRILNRFTADFHSIDSRIGYDIGFFVGKLLDVFAIMIAGMLVDWMVILLGIVLLLICLKLAVSYLEGARQVKRLESTAKSPVFEQFGSSLAGLITIRAFSKPDTYIEIMFNKINRHAQAWWNLWLFNRWLAFRMSIIGAIFSTVTAGLVVYLPGVSASLAGFALSFALQYNAAITMALRQYANIELNMNAIERVIEYSNIEIENQGGADAPAAWPTEGHLEVHDLVVGYAPDLPPVLNGLSFSVEKNQRVGVVGRTGAGKSSLTLALFRFLEARSGQIFIDGLDVSKIKLHDLRSRLAIIPQDPVLFSGTVRSNLDPFDEYSDTELYDALARVHLISEADDDELTLTSRTATPRQASETGTTTPATVQKTNSNAFTSLSATISEGGLNLSQGQRQLLCLARAIVSRPKIMVLDEATSAVDMETDALIQTSIRAEFGRNATTLLVIAHRLSTIADFDRILVMDAGKAAEFGTPRDLMGIEGGVFKNLVDNSGEKEVLEKMIFA
ncbi:hypothetical protein DTO027I6_732 [Penicillium roqueforti]|uniref:uncharacterized protein n=1 Tax=Penicillium roqueforti TaxID=5082 RepID=UPI00190C5E2C|nr:uncharacterized protein LCP9604111_6325 [Penicillium roqueforti]KAF9247626.1 hypothetical protein LCP9604111_6325 [Penicillium roqueforti]KAI2712395.1 hypothetical protein CBS147318_7828 [Penicillium roqueforti]KAI3126146.1 hypothetical protein CBS147330_6486 [Penicillium roqueforti]KAI3130397.1 hypothetical protein CBS147326_5895 [Penicillium roqueforti]KAI3163880.1 hypothetical protein DTO039G3_7651 [Penicillium roqueforti]